MPEAVTTALINAGILGPVLIAVGWYTLGLQRQLRESQEKRVEDAQRVVTQLLELNDRWNASFMVSTASEERLNESLLRLHEALREIRMYGVGARPAPPSPPTGAAE